MATGSLNGVADKPLDKKASWWEANISWRDNFRSLYNHINNFEEDVKNLMLHKDIAFCLKDEETGKDVYVFAHSFILQLKSRYFSTVIRRLFLKSLMGEGDDRDDAGLTLWELKPICITSEETDVASFKHIIKYMYLEEIDEGLDYKQTFNLLKAANHFQIIPLAAECEKILKEKSESDLNNVFLSYRLAETFNSASLMEEYLSVMLKNGETIMMKPEFVSISHSLLCKIVKSDDLHAPEKQVYLSCVRWAAAELQRRGIKKSVDSLRKVLDPVHRLIRYPLLTQQFINETVQPDGFISDDESLELTLFFLTKEEKMLKSFVFKERAWSSAQKIAQDTINEILELQSKLFPVAPVPVFENPNKLNHIEDPRLAKRRERMSNSSSTSSLSLISPPSKESPQSQTLQSLVGYSSESSKSGISVKDNKRKPNGEQHVPKPNSSPLSSEYPLPVPPPAPIISEFSPRPLPMENMDMSISGSSSGSENGEREDRKRKSSEESRQPVQVPAPPRKKPMVPPPPPPTQDHEIVVNGSLTTQFSKDDIRFRLSSSLSQQRLSGLHQITKIRLNNVILKKRKNALADIMIPYLTEIEIVFDSTSAKGPYPAYDPDDYLIFKTLNDMGTELELDEKLWNRPTKMVIWENGVRRFEIDPDEEKSLIVNMSDDNMGSKLVQKLISSKTDKLAIFSASISSHLKVANITHLILHRCEIKKPAVLLEFRNLEKFSWVGFFTQDNADLSFLKNCTGTLKNLALCNMRVSMSEILIFPAVRYINLEMCYWKGNFELDFNCKFPKAQKIFITAFHSYFPSDILTEELLVKMRYMDNVLIAYPSPHVLLRCAQRTKESNRFLKYLEKNVKMNNPNMGDTKVPEAGFYLRRAGNSWSLLNLPKTSSPEILLKDKEYYEFFMLGRFSMDMDTFFKETQYTCKHVGCLGRYFRNGNIVALCLHEQNLEGSNSCCTNFSIGQILLSPSGLANVTPVINGPTTSSHSSPLSLASNTSVNQVIQGCDNISSNSSAKDEHEREEGELSTTSVKFPNPPQSLEMSSVDSSESSFSPEKFKAKKQGSSNNSSPQLSLVSSKESSKNVAIPESRRFSTSSSGSAEYNKFITQQRLERDRKLKVWTNRRRSPSNSSSSSSSTSSSNSSGSSSYATTSEYSLTSSGSDTRASPRKLRPRKRNHSKSRSRRSHSPFRKKAKKSNRARNPSPPPRACRNSDRKK